MSAKSDRINEIKALIAGLAMQKRCLMSIGNNPDHVRREIARIEERIVKDTKDVERMRHEIENWSADYDACTDRITELRKELVEVEHGEKLEKLRELVGELADIMTPEQLQAMLSQTGGVA